MKSKSYLINGRLGDIIALINYLSLTKTDYAKQEKLIKEIGTKPQSTDSWIQLCKLHPEFFMYDTTKSLIYLTYRKYSTEKVSVDNTIKLIEIATALQDKELNRRNRNTHRIPLYIAILTTLFSVFTLLYGNHKIDESLKEMISKQKENKENYLLKIDSLENKIDSFKRERE